MVQLKLSKVECLVFLASFILSFYLLPQVFVLVWAILFLLFVSKRAELYFLWSILAPRITGGAPILSFLLALAREEGPGNDHLNDILQLKIPFVPRLVFVFKDTYARRILVTEPERFSTTGAEGAMVQITGGSAKNILLSPGPPSPHWARYREVTAMVNRDRFGAQSTLAQMVDIAWKSMQQLTTKHFESKCDMDLLLFKELFEVMIPSHNRALFGEEFARKYTYENMSAEIYDIISETGKQLKFNFCPPWLKSAYNAKIKRVTDAVGYMMKDSTSAFMKPLLEATREGKITEEELLANAMVFEFAQAPLHVVFWALYLLSMHMEEEKKVVAEIIEVLSRGPISYERLPELRYTSRVIMETLRLFPGVGLLQVRAARENTLFGPHFIPQGSLIFLCAYLTHRNASYWPNPDEFIPSRDGIDAAHYGENLAYIPFGNGPRQCQGQYFALDFVKLSLVSILMNYQVTLAPSQQRPEPTEIGFLRPVYPLAVRFAKRVLPIPSVANDALMASNLHTTASSSRVTKMQLDDLLAVSEPSRVPRPKALPPRLSRNAGSRKIDHLIYQSLIFKDSFTSIDKIPGETGRNKKELLVLYGTQTGTSRGFALRLGQMATLCRLGASVVSLSDVLLSIVPQYKIVAIVTSTYGDGGPPENAEKFCHQLEKELSPEIFRNVQYAVLALGSSMYPFPFKFGIYVSKQFERLGARRLIPDHKIDEIRFNQQQEFTTWSARFFEAVGNDKNKAIIAHYKKLGFHDFDFNLLQAPFRLTFNDKTLEMEACSYYNPGVILATVVSNELANSDDSNLIYSMEASFELGSLDFQAGDSIGVIPANPIETVRKLISRLGYQPSQVFSVETSGMNILQLACSLGLNTCTLEIAFSFFIDITNPPSVSLLNFFGMHCRDPSDQKLLASYAANYSSFLRLQYSLLDILETLPSIALQGADSAGRLAVMLGLLGPIRHRFYSVANFPGASPRLLRIVYKVVDYETKDGRVRKGLCTNFMKNCQAGDKVPVFVARTKFRLPEDANIPILLVSTGSGISPYLSFLEQRASQQEKGDKLGPGILVHGCRTELDFAHKPKVDRALTTGALSQLYPAYSRQHDVKSVHVQDIVEQHGAQIWQSLNMEGAIMYVCGDVAVGTSIREALVRIAKEHGKLSIFLAHAWVRKLAENRMLRLDEWGIATMDGSHSIRMARLRLWRRSILAIYAFHCK